MRGPAPVQDGGGEGVIQWCCTSMQLERAAAEPLCGPSDRKGDRVQASALTHLYCGDTHLPGCAPLPISLC